MDYIAQFRVMNPRHFDHVLQSIIGAIFKNAIIPIRSCVIQIGI